MAKMVILWQPRNGGAKQKFYSVDAREILAHDNSGKLGWEGWTERAEMRWRAKQEAVAELRGEEPPVIDDVDETKLAAPGVVDSRSAGFAENPPAPEAPAQPAVPEPAQPEAPAQPAVPEPASAAVPEPAQPDPDFAD